MVAGQVYETGLRDRFWVQVHRPALDVCIVMAMAMAVATAEEKTAIAHTMTEAHPYVMAS